MKKLIALLLVLVMCIGLFVGCNTTPDPTEAPATDAPTEAPATDAPTEAPATNAPTEAPATNAPTEAPAADPNQEGWLRLGDLGEKFDYTGFNYGGWVKNFLFSRLLLIDGQGNVTGGDLAEEYAVSEDGLTWTFKIKDNAKWHDGTDLTAADVKFSFEMFALGAQVQNIFANSLANLEGWAAVKEGTATEVSGIIADGKNLTLKCTQPCSTMAIVLGQICILPQHLLGEVDPLIIHDDPYWIQPVGSGFYKVGQYVQGKYWTLTPNADFYDADRIPQIQNIYLGYAAGGTTSDLLMECQAGNIHIGTTMNPDEITEISKLDNYTLIPADIIYLRFLQWNAYGHKASGESGVADVRVRRAMMHAIDTQAICDEMFSGFATRLNTKVPTSFDAYLDDAYVYDYNPEKAKQLLDEAGYDWDYELKLIYYYADQQSKDVMDAVVFYLNEIGMKAQAALVTGDVVQAIYVDRDYDFVYGGHSAMCVDEVYGNFANIDPETNMGKVRPVGGSAFDALYNELVVTTDEARRADLLKQLQKTEFDYLWDLPLFTVSNNIVIRNDMLDVGTLVAGNEWFNYDRDVETWNLLKIEDPTA